MSEFPRIFAHRGASSLAPENTIAAFAKAMEVGARWFEFDVDITGDGSLIVIHDDTLDRTTTGSGSYYQLGFSDIRRLDAGRWFSDTYRFERIPEAADALAFPRPPPRRNRPPDRIQLTRPIVKQVILRVHRSRLRLRQKPLERHQNTTQSFPRFWRRSHSGDARRALYPILAPITQTAASILFGDFGDSFRTVT